MTNASQETPALIPKFRGYKQYCRSFSVMATSFVVHNLSCGVRKPVFAQNVIEENSIYDLIDHELDVISSRGLAGHQREILDS